MENWAWRGSTVLFAFRKSNDVQHHSGGDPVPASAPHDVCHGSKIRCEVNRLVVQIQPAEGIQLHFHTKVPDAGMQLRLTELSFPLPPESSPDEIPDAYQRLLLDVMNGDASLFARADEVELAWGIIDPILESLGDWSTSPHPLRRKGSGDPGRGTVDGGSRPALV